MKKTLITFDWALKKLLRSRANFDILEGFLSELLLENIKIQEILESESNKHTEEDKQNRVDLLVLNSKNELVIIEVQQSVEHDYFQRMLLGTCKALTDFMYAGSKYSSIKKVISISIVTFDLGHGEDYLYRGTTSFIGMNRKDKLQLTESQKIQFKRERIADIYPEYYLLKVNQFDNYAKTSLDEWVYFLKNSEIKDDFTAKGLQKAKDIFKVMNMSEDERRDYEKHLEYLSYMASLEETREMEMSKAKRKGIEQGIEQGKISKAESIAKVCKAKGLTFETISEITGLSIETIEKL